MVPVLVVIFLCSVLTIAVIGGGAVASGDGAGDAYASDRLTMIDNAAGWETDSTASAMGTSDQPSAPNSTVSIANATVTEESPSGNTAVKADADEPVAGSSTFVEFDPDDVTVDAIVGGAFEDLAYEVDNDEGWIRIETADATGLDDPEIAEIQFTGTMDAGEETTLSLTEESILWNEHGESFSPDLVDGTIVVTAADPSTVLAIDDVTVSPADGSNSTTLYATSGEAVAGFQSFLTFDPDVVTIVDVETDDLDTVLYEKNNEAGWLHVAGAEAVGVDDPTLATITFETSMEPGAETILSLGADSVVNDELGAKLDTALEDGTITFDSPAERKPSADGHAGDSFHSGYDTWVHR